MDASAKGLIVPSLEKHVSFAPLSKQTPQRVASEWFRASEAAGDFMGIRYGRVPGGAGEVEWSFVSHMECDGIGGFARMLRGRGVETGKLPQTKHPCRGVITPLWNLWRDSRKQQECAVRSDWLLPGGAAEAVAWHLFTAEETREMLTRCRCLGVTVNSFLLKHLDQAIRPGIRKPGARIRWLIPVNLRGEIQSADDTANHVSGVEVRIAPDDNAAAIQTQILRRLERGEHRANHLLLMAGGMLSHAAKVRYLRKDRAKPAGNIGSFSNLGVWDVNVATGDGWVFCPPVVTGQLVGAGCVTFQGRLGLAIQGHSTGCMERWLDLIRSSR
jgi:hypothetical protein